MGFIDSHDDVLNMIQDMTYNVLTRAYEEFKPELDALKAPPLILKEKFPHYSVAQVHKLYTEATGTDTTNEKDLIPDEEKWICEYAKDKEGCEAVYVTGFPIEAMKFYHMIDPDDPTIVLWADLLFRGLEIATCPQREHHHEKLVEQIKKAGIDPAAPGFKYFLQAFEYGLPPHGGCGYGIDRLVEKTIGLGNIKEAILFPRDLNRLTP
jgi:aspartyl/asparaginyl-tRNA synthetase